MANPNPEIYGAPETWHNCYYGGGSTQPWAALLHAERAKVPTWDTAHPTETPTFENSQLRYAVDDNKLTPSQPIDNSLCAIGQGTASPFRQFTIFRNDATTEQPNGEILQVGHAYTGANYNDNNIVNTFWFESNSFTAYGNYGNGAFSRGRLQIRDGATITQGIDQRIWSPTGVNSHGTSKQNGNFYIAPFVSYGSRTYVLQIWVWVTNADYDAEFVPGSGAPAGSWKTLDDWKNNYSSKAITACLLTPRVISTYNSSTGAIGYFRVNFESTQYRKVASGILDTIKFDFDDGYSLPDLTAYGLFSANSNTNIGVALFNEMTLYKWSDTLQNIGIVNSYIASYIRSNGQFMTPYIPYSDDIYEWIMSTTACFGMAFTPAKATGADASYCVFNQSFTDTDLCLPIITDSGVANGEYTRGSDNANNDFIDLSSQWDKNYDPVNPPHNQYYDHTDLPSLAGTATNWYTDVTLGSLEPAMNVGNLCNAIAALADNPYNKDFLFQEPLKNVLEYRRILLTQPWERATSLQDIPLGAFTAQSPNGFAGYKNFPRFRRVTLGSFSFDREFNNFLDFEPYTQAILYVPYCGIKQLPMNIFAGHTVNIYMNADNTSGVLQVLIFVDNIEWGTLSGMASEELPLVGETALTAANTKRELDYQQGQLEWAKMIGMGGSVAGASISAANRNPVGLIAQGASALFKNYYYNTQQAELQYQINHTKPEPLTIQKGDSSIDKMNVQYPFIMIQSPVIIGDGSFENIKQNYGRTKGFKCCETGVIGDFSGLTKCSAANLNGISCTYTEKKMIMEALQEGVIL